MKPFNKAVISYGVSPIETPYLRAKQVWDNRISVFALCANHWRNLAIASLGITLLLMILLAISLSWHKPQIFVAEVTSEGQVLNVKLLKQNYDPTEAQEEYFVSQFIKLLRGLPLDPVVAKHNWLSAYQFLNERGTELLNSYFKNNNPLNSLGKQTVEVNITDINPLSKNSYQVDWVEETIGQNGQIITQENITGTFTIVIHTPRDKREILENPLGIYITDFHFSQKLSRNK